MNHFDYLMVHVPDLKERRILDLGSGRGKFLFYCKDRGVDAVGLELNPDYIASTHARAKELEVEVRVMQGVGEHLPFPDGSFDFINISEVIEHVNDPAQMLREVSRVLSSGGYAYLSVPNRFGLKDPHFHLYGVNWLPRALAGAYIALWGRHKDYAGNRAGHQRLDEMHYYSWRGISRLLLGVGLSFWDQRVLRIKSKLSNPILATGATIAYLPFRFAFFDAFHLLIKKEIGHED